MRSREHSNLYLNPVLGFRTINARNRHKLPHVLVFWLTLEIKSDQVFLVREHISARHPETAMLAIQTLMSNSVPSYRLPVMLLACLVFF
jgi:hypothetical protein